MICGDKDHRLFWTFPSRERPDLQALNCMDRLTHFQSSATAHVVDLPLYVDRCNVSRTVLTVNWLACCLKLNCYLILLSRKADTSFEMHSCFFQPFILLFILCFSLPVRFVALFIPSEVSVLGKINISYQSINCSFQFLTKDKSLFFTLCHQSLEDIYYHDIHDMDSVWQCGKRWMFLGTSPSVVWKNLFVNNSICPNPTGIKAAAQQAMWLRDKILMMRIGNVSGVYKGRNSSGSPKGLHKFKM